jgi:hypothetical protein
VHPQQAGQARRQLLGDKLQQLRLRDGHHDGKRVVVRAHTLDDADPGRGQRIRNRERRVEAVQIHLPAAAA